MDLLDRDLPRNDTYVQISAAGAGALSGETPYAETTIAKLMPGFATGNALIGLETQTANAIVLYKATSNDPSQGQVQVLHIIGGPDGKIVEIDGVSRHVVGPAGERPGMTMAQTGADPATCRSGTALWVGMALCASSAAPNVRLLFGLSKTASGGKLPPRTEMEKAELQRIIWTPQGHS